MGDQAAAILSQYRHSEGIAVILHSELEEERLAAMVEETGATGFIRKTTDAGKLVDEVRRWLGSRRLDAEPRPHRTASGRHPLAS